MTAHIPTLTLWQPYASLIAEGVKRIETRSWKAPDSLIGQRIAIHAAVRKPEHGLRLGPQTSVVAQEYLVDGTHLLDLCNEQVIGLPLGAIVATARLTDCVPMVECGPDAPENPGTLWLETNLWPERYVNGLVLMDRYSAEVDVTDQLPYGDFAQGRWAWLLSDVAPTTERCPACDGTGKGGPFAYDDDPYYLPPSMGGVCSICEGRGVSEPIPWRGRQHLWRWQP